MAVVYVGSSYIRCTSTYRMSDASESKRRLTKEFRSRRPPGRAVVRFYSVSGRQLPINPNGLPFRLLNAHPMDSDSPLLLDKDEVIPSLPIHTYLS